METGEFVEVILPRTEIKELYDFVLLPGGKEAFLRYALHVKKGLHVGHLQEGCCIKGLPFNYNYATHIDFMCMMNGNSYPWGNLSEYKKSSQRWLQERVGITGLIHSAWFVLENKQRVGGAYNVPFTGPGALRFYTRLDGGYNSDYVLSENEGYAIKACNLSTINKEIYRTLHQGHIQQHVVPDGGMVYISPVLGEEDDVYVYFCGRCATCPNQEAISIKALQNDLHKKGFKNQVKLHPEFVNQFVTY